MKRRLLTLLFALLGLTTKTSFAEREQLVQSGRIYLGEVVPNLTAHAAALDLGASPKAGSSRLLTVDELNRALKTSGETRTVSDSVRVIRASRRWSQKELDELLSPEVTKRLPSYAVLVRLDLPRSLLTSQSVTVGNVELGQLPKRRGTAQTSAVIELTAEGQVESRLSLPLVVELAERPKPLIAARGQSVTVSIELGAARVSASATLLQATEVGGIGLCRILRTKKVLRVQLTSANTAEVVRE